jgi:hypothetical protein
MIRMNKKASLTKRVNQTLRPIYSGVRVRVQAADSICTAASQQPDKDDFTAVSAALSKKGHQTCVTITNTHQNVAFTSSHTKLIGKHSFLEHLLSLTNHSEGDRTSNIGTQTATLSRTDQETSCNIVELVRGSHKDQSSSETSVSVVNDTISDAKEDKSRHDRNHQNNNATDNHTARIDQQTKSEEVTAEKVRSLCRQNVKGSESKGFIYDH